MEPYEIQPRDKWAIYMKDGGQPIIVESIHNLNLLHVEARRLKQESLIIDGTDYVVADIAHVNKWREK